MNKTITANISGVVFHIESDAYDKLHLYLSTIRNYFKDSDGKDEIMADIEARIAELFKNSLQGEKEVILMSNVNKVIEVMGEPEQYMSEEDFEQESKTSESTNSNYKSKKLFRDDEEAAIGGVCAGIGHFFGVDKIWLRIAFLVAFFGFGFGIILYIILWAIIPTAKTTAERLEMRGEPININNIGKSIKDEYNNLKDSNLPQYGKKAENVFFRAADFIGKILLFLAKFVLKTIAVVLVLAGVIVLCILAFTFLGLPFHINVDDHNISDIWTQDLPELFFSSDGMFYIGLVGLCLVALIPIGSIIYGGIKLLFNIPKTNKAVNYSAFSLFIIGVILCFVSVTNILIHNNNRQAVTETIPLDSIQSDTLVLKSSIEEYEGSLFDGNEIFVEDGFLFIDDIDVNVKKTNNEEISLKIKKYSTGKNRKVAANFAKEVSIAYDTIGNTLTIDPYLSTRTKNKYRSQKARITVYLPIGKSIFLSRESDEIIYDIDNLSDTYDGDMLGFHWKMTKNGLRCTDCPDAWDEDENGDDDDED